jgi:hypothetical protein
MNDIKATFKNGPGSIGESTKVLANSYLGFSKNHSLENRKNAFEAMFSMRQTINRGFAREGDILSNTDFEKFYNSLSRNHTSPYKLEFDLPSFIFLILFFESEEYRIAFKDLDLEEKNMIYEVIYEVCIETASKAVVSKQHEFLVFAESFRLHYENIK